MVDTEEKLKNLIMEFERLYDGRMLKINVVKIKIMRCANCLGIRCTTFSLDRERLEEVLRYLGILVTAGVNNGKEQL